MFLKFQRINIGSPKQLGEILYHELKIADLKDKEVLQQVTVLEDRV